MMRLYMSSSTFKTGEFAILVTIISKGCNGYGAVCGYYNFCLLRDFPTVTKSPPLPQLPSSTHPLMHKHTCILTHTLPIYSMWCTNTHASKHTEPISAYICKYTHTSQSWEKPGNMMVLSLAVQLIGISGSITHHLAPYLAKFQLFSNLWPPYLAKFQLFSNPWLLK